MASLELMNPENVKQYLCKIHLFGRCPWDNTNNGSTKMVIRKNFAPNRQHTKYRVLFFYHTKLSPKYIKTL